MGDENEGDEHESGRNPDGATDDTGRQGDGAVLPDEVEYPQSGGEPGTALPRRVESWRRRSATGAMLTGFAFGLREVLEVEHREPAIVLETSGVPPKDLPVEADLDNLPPRQSVVRIRRWLLADRVQPDSDNPDGTAPDGTAPDALATDGATDAGAPDAGATDAAATGQARAAPRPPTELRRRDTSRKRRLRSPRLGHPPRRS